VRAAPRRRENSDGGAGNRSSVTAAIVHNTCRRSTAPPPLFSRVDLTCLLPPVSPVAAALRSLTALLV